MMKKILITCICLLIITIGVGLWGYNYFFGVDDGLRVQLREELTEEFFSFEDLYLTNFDLVEEAINSTPSKNNSEEIIFEKYNAKLERLENVVNDKIDVLFQNAYHEYQQQIGKNKLNQTQIARKYLQAADMLEEAVDAIFQDVLTEMEMELQRSQLPTNLVREAEEIYNMMIRDKKSSIMQKIDGVNR